MAHQGEAPGSGAGGPRASARSRTLAKAVARVDAAGRRAAATARLDALEADNAGEGGGGAADDSDEYVDEVVELAGTGPVGVARRKKAAKRTTRARAAGAAAGGGGAAGSAAGPRPLSALLAESGMDQLPPGVPSYARAEMGPPRASAPLKLCSVCGFGARYTCARCGARYCHRACMGVHADTRCLRFVA